MKLHTRDPRKPISEHSVALSMTREDSAMLLGLWWPKPSREVPCAVNPPGTLSRLPPSQMQRRVCSSQLEQWGLGLRPGLLPPRLHPSSPTSSQTSGDEKCHCGPLLLDKHQKLPSLFIFQMSQAQWLKGQLVCSLGLRCYTLLTAGPTGPVDGSHVGVLAN